MGENSLSSGVWPSLQYPSAKTGGTTPVPNLLLDVLMPTLSDTQLRVLLVVARSTLGWRDGAGRKESDWLSHRQLQKRSGRAGAAVSGAIDALVQRGLLEVRDGAGERRATSAARRATRGPLFYRLSRALTSQSEVESSEILHSTAVQAKQELGSTSERRLHKAKTTKENGTKENRQREISFDLSSLESEVLCIGEEQIADLLEIPNKAAVEAAETTTAVPTTGNQPPPSGIAAVVAPPDETEAFIRLFQAAYSVARPGESCPPVEAEDCTLLDRYLAVYGWPLLERWLPAFFASNFGYVRRRSWSLRSYLDSVFVIQAQKGRSAFRL